MSSKVHPLKTWLMATRPKTLTAALVPILVGTALAYACRGTTRIDLSVLAFLSSIFIQIGTNFINDALDFKKGADTAERLGPQRVTQSGLLTPQQVMAGGMVCFLIAALLGIPLIIAGGWPLLVIGIFSLLAGYAYTGGPYPLAYVGLGDFFVLVFFGWVAVGGVYFLNTGLMDWNAAVAGTQVGLLATIMIAINNLRDHVTDRKAQKRTLAVRLGPTLAKAEIAALCIVPFLCGAYWYGQGFSLAACIPFVMLPLALALPLKIKKTEPGIAYNQFLAKGAALHLGFGVLLSIGLALK